MKKIDIIIDALIFNSDSNVIKILWEDIKQNNLNLNPFEEIKVLENISNVKDATGSYLFDNKYDAWKQFRGIK